jgi:hypothetical protein
MSAIPLSIMVIRDNRIFRYLSGYNKITKINRSDQKARQLCVGGLH